MNKINNDNSIFLAQTINISKTIIMTHKKKNLVIFLSVLFLSQEFFIPAAFQLCDTSLDKNAKTKIPVLISDFEKF
jgi:hypothetical protein